MSRIVAVASGKGGVGKTWLAVTLGHALARLGRRVLLFDGDLGLANVDVQLGLPAGPDLGGVVAGRYRLAAAVRHVKAAGFDVVPGRSGSGGLALLPPPVVESLGAELQGLAEGYDVVVLDLCAGLERAVRQLAALAATHLVVATDEPTALTDAYAFIKISHRQGRGPEPRIVVNMAQSRAAGERTYATLARVCRNFLKIEPPLTGVVRRDSRVARRDSAPDPAPGPPPEQPGGLRRRGPGPGAHGLGVTGPTPPLPGQPPAPARASGAAATAGANPVRIEAVVIGSTRSGAVIETAAGRLLLTGMPPPPRGASLSLQAMAPPANDARATVESARRPARLLAIDGRALASPGPVQLTPAPASPPPRPAPTLPAQVIAPAAQAGGAPLAVQISPLVDPRGAPPTPANPAAGLPPGTALPAEVTGRDALGRPLVRAPGLVLRLEAGVVDLPPGARLRLTLPQGLPAAAQARSEDPLRPLVDALRAQESAAPAARALPRPDATFAALLLRLYGAVHPRDASPLQAEEAPPASRPAEASLDRAALREALTELGRLAREPLPGGWRVSLLPVVLDDAPTPLRLYLRDDHAASATPDAAVRRAVFDLDLSHLGRLQLDVLCQGHRCDLVVRSAAELPAALRAEVAALFEAAKDVTGLRGELGFRPGGVLALPDPRTPRLGVTA